MFLITLQGCLQKQESITGFLTVRLSAQVLAKNFSRSPKSVGKISRSVRGVFETTIFQTCKEAWRTTSWVSERPMYSPASTLFLLSTPRALIIAWKETYKIVLTTPEIYKRNKMHVYSLSLSSKLFKLIKKQTTDKSSFTLFDWAVPKLSSSEAVSVVIFPVTPEIWNKRSPRSWTELNLATRSMSSVTTG